MGMVRRTLREAHAVMRGSRHGLGPSAFGEELYTPGFWGLAYIRCLHGQGVLIFSRSCSCAQLRLQGRGRPRISPQAPGGLRGSAPRPRHSLVTSQEEVHQKSENSFHILLLTLDPLP
ncbi:unnamed protein product [Gadus morhua 'NCC']